MTTTIDLRKVQFAKFGWRNGAGLIVKKRPRKPTVAGHVVTDALNFDIVKKSGLSLIAASSGESQLAYAKRKGLLDVWTPIVRFQFAANHSAAYTGDRAKALWREWQARIFGKKKGIKCT